MAIKPNMNAPGMQPANALLGSAPLSIPNPRDEAGSNYFTTPIAPGDMSISPPKALEELLTSNDCDHDDDREDGLGG